MNRVTPISDIIKTVFSQLEKTKTISKEDVEEKWKGFVGESGFKHSRPMVLRKGVLTVRVDSSAWMHDIALRKRKILKQLKSTFGKDRISEIHFKIGEF